MRRVVHKARKRSLDEQPRLEVSPVGGCVAFTERLYVDARNDLTAAAAVDLNGVTEGGFRAVEVSHSASCCAYA